MGNRAGVVQYGKPGNGRTPVYPAAETAEAKRFDMTTRYSDRAKPKRQRRFVLPEPPRDPEDMTSFQHLSINGNAYLLNHHLGHSETTIVTGELFLTRTPRAPSRERVAPDLMVAFNAKPEAFKASNGYIVSEQGKPPDFVMEIASPKTGSYDVGEKRDRYAALGVPEYWRFDETGAFHGARLGGDQLVNGEYQPIPIATLEDDALQGYSPALNLFIRWEKGELRWYDPGTGRPLVTIEEAEASIEGAQARIRQLEEELARRDAQP